MNKALEKIDGLLKQFELFVMFLAGVMLFGLVVLTVTCRYLLKIPTPFDTELARTFHIWLAFIGSSYLVSKDGHPAVEFISSKVSTSSNRTFKIFYFSIIYFIMLLFIVPAFVTGLRLMPLYAKQVTNYLSMPYSIIYGGGILGLFLMIVRCLMKITGLWG
ncbi:MAG: TRAP transporter small permease subunit [Thermosediminibacteraceae bacterium]|nr:TRAP transporter small permease subunit [Thermosediminibacteraceae bacterium]